MIKKTLAVLAAASLATTPAMAASGASALSLQPTTQSDDGGAVATESGAGGGIFAAEGAGIGIALFATVIVLGVLLATGTIFDDDEDRPISV